ncbi:MAG: hypothetical protein KW802_03255 [Candidatus Doudnabacteria bacterium]|nr:hypothetical protein [Candidatus Doudnabacteria bacterium]
MRLYLGRTHMDFVPAVPSVTYAYVECKTSYQSEKGEALLEQLTAGANFWHAVAYPIRHHDVTRADVIYIMNWALRQTRGNLHQALPLLNLRDSEELLLHKFLGRWSICLRINDTKIN